MTYTWPDWFSEHIPAWRSVLQRRLAPVVLSRTKRQAKQKPVHRFLFIGPYDGRCIEWVLTEFGSDNAYVTVIDDFEYEPCVNMRGTALWAPKEKVRDRFDKRMAALEAAGRLGHFTLIEDSDAEGLVRLRGKAGKAGKAFDLIYINATSSAQAMETLVLAFPMLKGQGALGTLIVTNNVHGKNHDAACPRRGIDGFMDAYTGRVRLLRNGFHIFIEARKTALELPCQSEVYDGQERSPVCRSKTEQSSPLNPTARAQPPPPPRAPNRTAKRT
jgi:hypothetical protein